MFCSFTAIYMFFELHLRYFHVALFSFLGTFHVQVYNVIASVDSTSSVAEGAAWNCAGARHGANLKHVYRLQISCNQHNTTMIYI